MSNNPYVPPAGFGGPSGPPPVDVAAKVSGPAIGLMVTAGIGIAFQVLALAMNVLGVGVGAAAAGGDNGGPEGAQLMVQGVAGMVGAVIGIIVGIVIIMGALKMKNLQSYGFAMAAAIIAAVPCVSPCCLIGLPVGIWAVMVLNDPYVKQSFR
ncbi:MAG: hypothetical protein U0939_19490 [Pirellulales bacterium]